MLLLHQATTSRLLILDKEMEEMNRHDNNVPSPDTTAIANVTFNISLEGITPSSSHSLSFRNKIYVYPSMTKLPDGNWGPSEILELELYQ